MTRQNPTATLKIRRVTQEDCRLLWEWANDPVVRGRAFSSESIPWSAHERWFQAKLKDPDCTFLLITDEQGQPMGQVRFDKGRDGTTETDLSVAPSLRGQGLGPQVLKLACKQLPVVSPRARRIIAAIKPENKASIRTFEKVGFRHEGQKQVKGNRAIVMSMEVHSR